MKKRYTTAAASLAAFIVAVGPAAAQVSTGLDAPNPGAGSAAGNIRSNTNVDQNTNTTGGTMPGGADSTSGSATSSGSYGAGGAGSTSGGVSSDTNSNTTSNDSTQSPSASPQIGDDKATGLDRADQAAGEHGQQGRDNARERGSRQQ